MGWAERKGLAKTSHPAFLPKELECMFSHFRHLIHHTCTVFSICSLKRRRNQSPQGWGFLGGFFWFFFVAAEQMWLSDVYKKITIINCI